jgi:hypothetical protein
VIDPRPICRFCGRRWTPAEGVDANVHFCGTCSPERRAHAAAMFDAEALEAVEIEGGYEVRALKNA